MIARYWVEVVLADRRVVLDRGDLARRRVHLGALGRGAGHAGHEERAALQTFEDQVIDRLFLLNAQRAEEEKRALPPAPAKGAKKSAAKKGETKPGKTAASRPRVAGILPGFEEEGEA